MLKWKTETTNGNDYIMTFWCSECERILDKYTTGAGMMPESDVHNWLYCPYCGEETEFMNPVAP